MDYIQHRAVEKIVKMLDRGLDPNFHDLETGGESRREGLGGPSLDAGSARRFCVLITRVCAAPTLPGF